ncbi:MAG: arylsulfatase [Gammaproteobacteria bacterium]|nr:arylsulfatase [Gammaproteobacteria bacterium]MCY4210012.1 arylsulfatase [Gammaproteobacteria bacterium]MCY4282922.1 arylsulfatase [Gammaproteobacteria bacterium]MCY4337244.1 arylsulfatase [Gammaproteobacteria bacterium]
MKPFLLPILLSALLCLVSACGSDAPDSRERPNVLLIVVDDVAFNDLGLFGSEIRTPNIDALARAGVFFTNFHVAPNCSPTRAMLFSGMDSHNAGLGTMFEDISPNQQGQRGYEGYLNFEVAALSELFLEAGYNTYMAGKWHLGLSEETSPAARGFEKSYAMLQGGAGAFGNMLPIIGPGIAQYRENGISLEALPEDFYSTRFYTELMQDYISADLGDGKPFFAYLAYTSPHWPLHAPQQSIARYRGIYDAGYDALAEQRLQNLIDHGLVAADVRPFPKLLDERDWDELSPEEQRYQAKLMEIYAAMVDDVDVYIGQLIDYLKEIDEYDNTVILFMSDNGPEGHAMEKSFPEVAAWARECCDNSYENIGNADSYVWLGPSWARAGNTPLRMFKGYTSQGGVRAPAFFHYPGAVQTATMNDSIITVKDIMPTLLEFAGIEHPGAGTFQGRQVQAMQGRSLLPLLTGARATIREPGDYMGWELFGKQALRQDDWKIIYVPSVPGRDARLPAIKPGQWQLYNLADDPAEMNDLAASHPQQLQQMLQLWEQYVAEINFVYPNTFTGY